MILKQVKEEIIANDFTLPKHLQQRLTASRSDELSGILEFKQRKMYFSIIKPWEGRPEGQVIVEYV